MFRMVSIRQFVFSCRILSPLRKEAGRSLDDRNEPGTGAEILVSRTDAEDVVGAAVEPGHSLLVGQGCLMERCRFD